MYRWYSTWSRRLRLLVLQYIVDERCDRKNHIREFSVPPVAEMLSCNLKQWLSTRWEGRAKPWELRYALHLSDWKGWSQDPPLPRPYLRVGSGGKGISLAIPATWGLPRTSSFFPSFLCPRLLHWAYPHLLQPRTLLLCCHCCAFHHIIALHALTPMYLCAYV